MISGPIPSPGNVQILYVLVIVKSSFSEKQFANDITAKERNAPKGVSRNYVRNERLGKSQYVARAVQQAALLNDIGNKGRERLSRKAFTSWFRQ